YPAPTIHRHASSNRSIGCGRALTTRIRRVSNVTKINSNACETSLAVQEVAELAREIYARVGTLIRLKQRLRPYICPLHALIEYIPSNANVLDVGCGAGLFIALLGRLGRIQSA